MWVNPYASTESQKILFPQQYLQRNKTNMTLFQVALPRILDYLLERKRSGPLLSLFRLHLLSLSAWNSQVEIFSVLIHPTLWRSHKDTCNLFTGWGVGPSLKCQYRPYLLDYSSVTARVHLPSLLFLQRRLWLSSCHGQKERRDPGPCARTMIKYFSGQGNF